MTDRPIHFSGPMVRALVEGRKTQTRRVLADSHVCDDISSESAEDFELRGWVGFSNGEALGAARVRFAVGDRLWVREAHALLPRTAYRGSVGTGTIDQREHPTDGYTAAVFREGFDRSGRPRWRPSIHMPRWASRLTLTVTNVRVQRLQDMEGQHPSESDAIAEGVNAIHHSDRAFYYSAFHNDPHSSDWCDPKDAFRELWDSLNAKRGFGWNVNPWVVALTFDVARRNIDAAEA